MGEELGDDFYDKVYRTGGNNKMYFKDAKDMVHYYPTWLYAYDYIKKNNIKTVIDFGCGPGHFSTLFNQSDGISYLGYDFSEVAIDQAIERNKDNLNNRFEVQDLKSIELSGENDFYTSFEFLEHVSFDIEIVSKLKKGDEILFSVPNYDSAGHFIYYDNFNNIVGRFGGVLSLSLAHEVSLNNNGKKIYLCHGVRI